MKKQQKYVLTEKDKQIIKEVYTFKNICKEVLKEVASEAIAGSIITLIVIAILAGSVYETKARMAVNSSYKALQSIFMVKAE